MEEQDLEQCQFEVNELKDKKEQLESKCKEIQLERQKQIYKPIYEQPVLDEDEIQKLQIFGKISEMGFSNSLGLG